MRIGGAALFFIGVIATIVCTVNGFHSFFAWNGRHPVDGFELQVGENHQEISTRTGRRYTVSVKAIFDPLDTREKNGQAAAWLNAPLVVRVTDAAGTKLAEMNGWLNPDEPPNVFYTRPLHVAQPGGPHEISVERLVGPFMSSSDKKVDVFVDLGADREMRTHVLRYTMVVYDDALPGSIRNAAIGATASLGVTAVGFVFLLRGWWRSRRRKKRKAAASVAAP